MMTKLITNDFPEALILLAILILCLAFSQLFLRKLDILPNQVINRNSTLDGLRGILALSVLAHHFYITYTWKIGIGWVKPNTFLLNNLGSVSVSLFFLITGFLFINKLRDSNLNWKKLYFSRIKRIFPLYVSVFLLVTVITFFMTTDSYHFSDFLTYLKNWLRFKGATLGGFDSSRVIAYVQWTLLYEWGFYFLLPVIYIIWHRKLIRPFPLWLILIFLAAYYILRNSHFKLYYLFALAIPAVIFASQISSFISKKPKITHCLVLTVTLINLFLTDGYSTLQMCLTAFIFAFIANGYSYFGILNNLNFKKLGEISFSIYLTHGIVLYLAFTIFHIYDFSQQNLLHYIFYFPLIFIFVILCSLITYHFIEKPFLYSKKNNK